ncbi:hypothetical protein GCM10007320_66490 [Pseudorhodoferax aquiterrae]|uniref:Uncharacterized protein n=1 Tax=Pseudorhodoferax aquiterrae TaxID=747304 RepID=A0ABQ3GG92_9BURK|nr:hypothetical protein [Pseudorhodoferax aquiterrae]GHD04997.1 hypothetical protein GCM10007320_66490 [Pseudorhodoferax aquiterrae]
MTTEIYEHQRQELDHQWKASNLLPVMEEDETAIGMDGHHLGYLVNVCPEVTFKYFGYYTSYLARYVDEIDKASGERRAQRERLEDDWRFEWARVAARHFTDCSVFHQVQRYNVRAGGKFQAIAHPNVLTVLERMEHCLETDDPSGALHAASNALETLAKHLLDDRTVDEKPLGNFIDKYEKASQLPNEFKAVARQIYNVRNRTPLSGHGSTNAPSMTMQDAIVIAAATNSSSNSSTARSRSVRRHRQRRSVRNLMIGLPFTGSR